MKIKFFEQLKNAEEEAWTGILSILKDSVEVGSVVFHEGHVAWAVGKYQLEHFGSFLERVGMVPKEQQKDIIHKIRAMSESKELISMLEETGLITRTKLRECLKGHIQSAVASLMELDDTETDCRECELSVNSYLVFRLNEILPAEILPRSSACVADPENFSQLTPYNPHFAETGERVLKSLTSLGGYQYSFVYDLQAKILVSHKAENIACNIEEQFDSSIIWLLSSATMMKDLLKGSTESLMLEHDKGLLIAQWPEKQKDYFIAASFDKEGKPGVIKHKISEMLPVIKSLAGEML